MTGLGAATPPPLTNLPGSGQAVNARVLVGLNDEGVPADAVYAPSRLGEYLVRFTIPENAILGPGRPFVVAVDTSVGLLFSQPSQLDLGPLDPA